MIDVKQLLSQLNSEQIKPVLQTEGAVLVIAGAGSGKTRVLTTRIAYIVNELKVAPENILAITFTNKAAGEMKERLSNFIEDSSRLWASTIHSMCVRILRRDIERLGYDKNFSIYDETDKDKALKRVCEDLGFDVDNFLKPAKNLISKAKNDCLGPDEFAKEYAYLRNIDQIVAIYKGYQNAMDRSNALDFDDLLCKTYELFVNNPDVAEYYAKKFRYVHIDEFQDTNKVQYEIAKILASYHGNLFVVGDDDQSIYAWRGAQIDNILNFDKIFKDAYVFKLERNYRSTKKILELANCIIANNTGRREKELYTENNEGVKVETFVGSDENNEATYVAMQIKNLLVRGYNYSDFAVFMRLNALSRPFEQEFTKYGIPYRIFGGFKFFERKEIKDVLSYLKLINNPSDDESFMRSITTPRRGIGEKSLQELREFAASKDVSMYEAVDYIDQMVIGNSARTRLINYKALIDSFRASANVKGASLLMKEVLEVTEFMAQFAEKSEENTSKRQNINELLNSAIEFENQNIGSSLADYLNSVTLSTDTDTINDGNSVTIATIHAAKGLEYKCVFVAGLDEDILPVLRNGDTDEDIEEERRLMYVAVTRAMERLYLTRALSRFMYGNRKYMAQSRFLKEGAPVLGASFQRETQQKDVYQRDIYQRRDNFNGGYQSNTRARENSRYQRDFGEGEERVISSNSGYSSSYAKSMLNSNKPKAVGSTNYSGYKSGVKVKHTKFGEGTVIMVKNSGDNLIVDVAFKGVGIKSLSVKYAPMEIIK